MSMKIILKEAVPKLGNAGEVKNVSDGYARNFLFPRGLAELATPSNLQTLNRRLAALAAAEAKELTGYRELADALSKTPLRFTLKIGVEGQAFGSITAKDIADALARAGVAVQKNWIELASPIKTTGEHRVTINLPHGILAEAQILVTPEADAATIAT